MIRVYQVHDEYFYIQLDENPDAISKIQFPQMDIEDKSAMAQAIVDELNQQAVAAQ